MIQEKDFLYRVPVKNVLVTAPGQVRNPEILVDLEGGKFMHGNILDANSTNKLIDQSIKDAIDNSENGNGNYVTKDLLEASVKDAIDNSIENGNYVTSDLLEAETSARTKGDEDLNTKIKAEQTRAEGKEKEISDKLAIVDGDSNTEGSFRKAIADVIAAAPEDLDTLKEIADKLAGYALKTELPTVPTNISQLTNDSNFITQQDADAKYALVNSLNTVNDSISSLRVGLSEKQNKITVNSVDVTDIETADITKLRTIVIDLIDTLTTSGLIRQNSNLE